MTCHKAGILVSAMVLLACTAGASGPPRARKPTGRVSLPYTVEIELRTHAPFIPDGRMTFSEFRFNVEFRNVVFVYEPSAGISVRSPQRSGRLFLGPYVFNDYQAGGKRQPCREENPWPRQFAASLAARQADPVDGDSGGGADGDPIPGFVWFTRRFKLTLTAHFGLAQHQWISEDGSATLDESTYEFDVPWADLFAGKMVSRDDLPYKSDLPEEQGVWWLAFVPDKGRAK